MAYTPTSWVDDLTAITAARMNNLETGVDGTDQALADHLADTSDAHDASAISVLDAAGHLTAADVEAALAELYTLIAAGGGASIPPPATTLPGSPADGQLALLTDSTTSPTYQWLFRYHAGSSNADKWEFVGGAAAVSEVGATEATSSSAYVALTTAGPAIALPRAGVYDIEIGYTGGNSSSWHGMSYDIGATAASDNDACRQQNAGIASPVTSVSKLTRKTGLSAVTLTAKYRATGGNSQFGLRFMRVWPVRVS